MSGPDIFLSYARTDRATARIFADCFVHEGFNVWWDAALHSGETFDEVIEQNLRDSKAVVVLWSPRSVASRWVRAEATLADRRQKLVPAIIEPCDRPIVFELTHAADLTEWAGDTSDARWRNFMHDLRRLVGVDAGAAASNQPATPPPAPREAPPAREPLRPGSSDVIFAPRAQAEPPPHPVHGSPAESAAEEDLHAEVHYLDPEGDEVAEGAIAIGSVGVKIGRVAPADVVLPHKSVSREHCIIGIANDELIVTDLNSTNGTFIDDERIRRATVLPVGSVLRVGHVSLRHALRSPDETSDRHGYRGGRLAAVL